jgi:hypothetical protein
VGIKTIKWKINSLNGFPIEYWVNSVLNSRENGHKNWWKMERRGCSSHGSNVQTYVGGGRRNRALPPSRVR